MAPNEMDNKKMSITQKIKEGTFSIRKKDKANKMSILEKEAQDDKVDEKPKKKFDRKSKGNLKDMISAPIGVTLQTYGPDNRLNEFFYDTEQDAKEDCEKRDMERKEKKDNMNSTPGRLEQRFIDIKEKAEYILRIVEQISVDRDQWTRIKQTFSFKKKVVITHALENLAFMFRQLQTKFLTVGEPPLVENTKYFDGLWQDIMMPITGLGQTLDAVDFWKYKHPEVFKIDGLALAKAIHFLGTELGHTAQILDRLMGPTSRTWTARTLKQLDNTGQTWRVATMKRLKLDTFVDERGDGPKDTPKDGLIGRPYSPSYIKRRGSTSDLIGLSGQQTQPNIDEAKASNLDDGNGNIADSPSKQSGRTRANSLDTNKRNWRMTMQSNGFSSVYDMDFGDEQTFKETTGSNTDRVKVDNNENSARPDGHTRVIRRSSFEIVAGVGGSSEYAALSHSASSYANPYVDIVNQERLITQRPSNNEASAMEEIDLDATTSQPRQALSLQDVEDARVGVEREMDRIRMAARSHTEAAVRAASERFAAQQEYRAVEGRATRSSLIGPDGILIPEPLLAGRTSMRSLVAGLMPPEPRPARSYSPLPGRDNAGVGIFRGRSNLSSANLGPGEYSYTPGPPPDLPLPSLPRGFDPALVPRPLQPRPRQPSALAPSPLVPAPLQVRRVSSRVAGVAPPAPPPLAERAFLPAPARPRRPQTPEGWI